MKKYDVAVIGGGFAGVAAALAAAREGAKVILIDKSNCLGGAAVNCLIYPFMPFATKINGKETPLSAGLFTTICEKLKERDALTPLQWATFFKDEELKDLLNDMVMEAGIDLLFHSYLSRVERQDNRILSATFATVAGDWIVTADYFIDATGNAQLSYLANCPTVQGRESDNLCQPMTLCFRLGNVDQKKFQDDFPRLQETYRKLWKEGHFINARDDILQIEFPIPNVVHFNTTRVIKKDPTSPIDVTEAEILARKQVYEMLAFLKEHASGVENSFLMMTAPEIGIRESRRVVGEYTLTQTDCVNLTKFEDGIAACNYQIDIHDPAGGGTSHYFFPEGEYYTIPYRSLIPKGMDNLLVAGRCISSDHAAQASYRIMPTVCSIGEAAGTAIGLAAREKISVQAVDPQSIRQILKDHNAFL